MVYLCSVDKGKGLFPDYFFVLNKLINCIISYNIMSIVSYPSQCTERLQCFVHRQREIGIWGAKSGWTYRAEYILDGQNTGELYFTLSKKVTNYL